MADLSKDVGFSRAATNKPKRRPKSPGAIGGFEALDVAPTGVEVTPKPSAEDESSSEQKERANDLFLRRALTKEQLEKAKQTRAGFEALIGRSNFLPAMYLEVGAATSRATCQIRTSGTNYRGQTGSWTGTGFLISPNILVTNHHVINSPAVAASAQAVFNYQLGIDGKAMTPKSFTVRPNKLFLTSPVQGGLDYTFVWVDGDPGVEFGNVRVNRQFFSIAEEEFANLISHPDGRMKEICIHENEVLWQDEIVVHYASDSEPGSSGASVCNNSWQLVALHHASKPSVVPDYPILNEGIKLSAIAADLERQITSGAAGAATAKTLLALFDGTDQQLGFFGNLGRTTGSKEGLEAVVETYRGDDQDVDVGFWNVEWLTKWYDTKATAVARVIKEFNLDVWVLEESSQNAAKAVVAELNALGLSYDSLDAEPDSPDGKQSCSLLWNTKTVQCATEPWGDTIEEWLRTKSTDFDDLDLGLEAVHGKIFDRYPALFKCTAPRPNGAGTFEFYLIPVHLKAMGEGSLRRRMASQILAAAVQRKIADGVGKDWIIGGDFNAELATEDFDALLDKGLVAAAAQDEQNGAFSYIKGPQSLIDHIFLSPNLAERYGADDYFIIAAEKSIPDYVDEISDHRPVLLRMNLAASGGALESKPQKSAALQELQPLLAKVAQSATTADGLEKKKSKKAKKPQGIGGNRDVAFYHDRRGYDAHFLGDGIEVRVPQIADAVALPAVIVDATKPPQERILLPYTHFSVAMHETRKMPIFTAVNIDGTQLLRIPRGGDAWFLDPRIPLHAQLGNELYSRNDLDRGHMVRRLDAVWGSRDVAAVANEDTFHYTNACPQHKDLNQREWNDLEDYILDNAGAENLKVCVFTGPVLRSNDPPYRNNLAQLPLDFWKVAVIVREDTGKLSATGYVLTQKDMIDNLEFAFGAFRTYQVSLRKIETLTGLSFGSLKNADPKNRGGLEAGGLGDEPATLVTGPESLVL